MWLHQPWLDLAINERTCAWSPPKPNQNSGLNKTEVLLLPHKWSLEVSSPGLWGRPCHTKPLSQHPSTIFFHHLEGGLIPAVQYGAVAVPAASLVAEWRKQGAGQTPFLNDTGCCMQRSACISWVRIWSNGHLTIRSLGEYSFYSGHSRA